MRQLLHYYENKKRPIGFISNAKSLNTVGLFYFKIYYPNYLSFKSLSSPMIELL